jgi:hypothetical protein
MDVAARLPLSRRSARILDVVVVLWVAAWIGVGVASAIEIRNLAGLAETVERSGDAITVTGRALGLLGQVPVVGDGPERLAENLQAAGEQISANGRTSRTSILRLSWLLGVSIIALPTVPVVGLYGPVRLGLAREARAIGTALDGGEGAFLEEFLARRAVQHLPYEALRAVSANPWADLAEGRFGPLAEAELRRLGWGGRRLGTGAHAA